MLKETTVYWAYRPPIRHQYKHALLMEPPILAAPSIIKNILLTGDEGDSYQACNGYKNYFSNTYMLTHALSANITTVFDGDKLNCFGDNSELIAPRNPIIRDTFRFTLDTGYYYFFCKDSVTVEQIPAFLHKTSTGNLTIGVGSFDISKWFRPITLDYSCPETTSNIVINRGEPSCYIRLIPKKDSKINLIQFNMTDELINITDATTTLKDSLPRLSSLEIYRRFKTSGLNKKALDIIEDNFV